MTIAVFVQIAKFTVRNIGGGDRRESAPQLATAYSSERCRQY
jgi:hypothetical protein